MTKSIKQLVITVILVVSAGLGLSCNKDSGRPGTVTVTFDSKGGTPATISVTVPLNERVPLPEYPARTGYDLVGWYWAKDSSMLFDYEYARVTDNIELIAKWAPGTGIRYTVSFDARGGQPVPLTQSVAANKPARMPLEPFWMDPRLVNAFKGWYKDKTLLTPFNFNTDFVTSNITLYAKWQND